MALPDINLTISGALYGVLVAANLPKRKRSGESEESPPQELPSIPQSWREADDSLREGIQSATRFLNRYTGTTPLNKVDRDATSLALVDALKETALSQYEVPYRAFVEVFVSAKQVLT